MARSELASHTNRLDGVQRMDDQRSSIGFVRGALLLAFVALYLFGLAIWTPLFLVWPRRYPDLTYSETVAVRWVLVRHIWSNLVRRGPKQRMKSNRQ